MNIGLKIKNARISKGLTQEQLGDLCGLQKSAIAKYECGRVVNIKRSTLAKLAEVLGMNGSDLIIESDPEESASVVAKVLKDPKAYIMIEQYFDLPEETQSVVRNVVDGFWKQVPK